ncbi:MAG: hypothetical protein II839_04830 [Kiritimatiellae bacterium]|nr:hypothetical protein [Kiritimatiellia bacterium]
MKWILCTVLSLIVHVAAIGVLVVFALRLFVTGMNRFLFHGRERLATRASVVTAVVAAFALSLQLALRHNQIRRDSAIRSAAVDGATEESVMAKLGPPNDRYRQQGSGNETHDIFLYKTPNWWLSPEPLADDYLLEFDSEGHFVHCRIDK